MHTVNELNYPILRYYDTPTLPKHYDFQDLYRKLSTGETLDMIVKHPDSPAVSVCKQFPDIFAPKCEINARNLRSFPIFRIPEQDIPKVDNETIVMLWYIFSHLWTPLFYKKKPEIVKGSTWDEMYYKDSTGYDEWLENKGLNGYEESGIIIRPHEEICELYWIHYTKEQHVTEMSFCFHGKELIYAHYNFRGFVSSELNIPKEFEKIARHRNVSLQEAFFQEDMYNILRWLYYKEKNRMEPKIIAPFKKFFDRSGYTDFKMETQIPCIMYEPKVLN